MKKAIISALLLVGIVSSDGIVGQICWKDSDCGYGEICVRDSDWAPSGKCIRGAR